MPTVIHTIDSNSPSEVVAGKLQKLVNAHALEGWEFYRVDEFTSADREKGCFGLLLSDKATYRTYNVVTFRRELPYGKSSNKKRP